MSADRRMPYNYHRPRPGQTPDHLWGRSGDPLGPPDTLPHIPAAVPTENVRMERQQSSKSRHAAVYARHRRLDGGLMAAVTVLSLVVTLAVCGLVAWGVITARQEEGNVANVTHVDTGTSHEIECTYLCVYMSRVNGAEFATACFILFTIVT